ncbi:MAG: 2-C-methyl-D-erythritol 4-phosphate cytidylyltransferase [Clostridiaceae bacterium]|jgi:2-C-methyl-D-erythritol 4-phosphate cytidylyltransferase|nr:2-C-methyl-D-erythritol 4-phosphate cytidylyltransferase [Clostridiaceae bacterium]
MKECGSHYNDINSLTNSNSRSLVSVVIAAAGKGLRMGIGKNKQYIELHGKPVLARTIQKFEDSTLVDEIIVVANEEELELCREEVVKKYEYRKVKAITAGGRTRQQSVHKGLCQVSPGYNIVLIHDGARPFIDLKSIERCIEAVQEHGAAAVAVPAKDSIKRADPDGFVEETVERNGLWSIQTPQGFRYELIMDAHRRAEQEGFDGTDDAVLAERAGHKVMLVMGSYNNIKITTKEDLMMADFICRSMVED